MQFNFKLEHHLELWNWPESFELDLSPFTASFGLCIEHLPLLSKHLLLKSAYGIFLWTLLGQFQLITNALTTNSIDSITLDYYQLMFQIYNNRMLFKSGCKQAAHFEPDPFFTEGESFSIENLCI